MQIISGFYVLIYVMERIWFKLIQYTLDLKTSELKYVINDKDCGKAFDIPSGEYRVGIVLYSNQNSVQLLSYQTKK